MLIVPYGIETRTEDRRVLGGEVLIVPYGIETGKKPGLTAFFRVLIVPYGIETLENLSMAVIRNRVNCTLWNWNNIFFL